MPNQLTASGLQVAAYSELLAFYTTQFETIFGDDINLDPDTPDGQIMGVFIQAVLDLEDVLVQVFSTFDPDNAFGTILDQRVAINGIQRQGGTFTITNVTLVTTQSVNLYGLDQDIQPVYTVADNAGNQWQLVTTQLGLAAGTTVLAFQAQNPGAVLTVPNTITNPVTVVLGVSSINNPSSYTTLGTNEETDAALKIRRQVSVSLPSQGYLQGLLAALENVTGVSFAYVEENSTASTNADGVPGHSIWVIVGGSYAQASVAEAIYNKRNAGCGMYGAISYNITQVDGSIFPVLWDNVVPQDIFIQFTATSLNGINPPNIAAIVAQLPGLFQPGVAAEVNINDLATYVRQIDSNTFVSNAGFSTSSTGPFTSTLSPASKKNQFVFVSANIIVIPMILSPVAVVVAPSATQQFTPLGGYGAMTYVILVNNSGGSINSSGLYTAGSTPNVIDTVQVTDSLGNTATALVTVS